MLILLSPAKTLDFETPATFPESSQPEFLDQSSDLVALLRGFSPVEIGRLMGISDALARLNAGRYASWKRPFTADNAKQAILAFNGDVYEGLDALHLSPAAFHFAQDHLRILSGLYGVLRPLDLMQPYRLEMSIRLTNPRGKDLYAFWGEQITAALNRSLAATQAQAVVNLASEEYFKAVKVDRLSVPVIQPVFEDWAGSDAAGRYKVVSFHAKRARGLMARHALTKRITKAEALKRFSAEGYAFAKEVSTDLRWVFRRRLARVE